MKEPKCVSRYFLKSLTFQWHEASSPLLHVPDRYILLFLRNTHTFSKTSGHFSTLESVTYEYLSDFVRGFFQLWFITLILWTVWHWRNESHFSFLDNNGSRWCRERSDQASTTSPDFSSNESIRFLQNSTLVYVISKPNNDLINSSFVTSVECCLLVNFHCLTSLKTVCFFFCIQKAVMVYYSLTFRCWPFFVFFLCWPLNLLFVCLCPVFNCVLGQINKW